MRIAIFVLLLSVASCGTNQKQDKPESVSHKRLVALFTENGEKKVGILELFIQDKIKVDSVTKIKSIVTDSVWLNVYLQPVMDTTKTPHVVLKNSKGQDSLFKYGIIIAKDSVSTRVENIDVDSLLKKQK